MKKIGFQKIISLVLVFILFFGGLTHFLGSSIVAAKPLLTPDGSLVLEPISDVESDAEKNLLFFIWKCHRRLFYQEKEKAKN